LPWERRPAKLRLTLPSTRLKVTVDANQKLTEKKSVHTNALQCVNNWQRIAFETVKGGAPK
jgi:hypothetical protein